MDLIDRQAAIDALNTRAKDTFTLADGYQYYLGALHDVADDLRRLPSAQPELIRCKDCKNNSNTGGIYTNCDVLPQMFGRNPEDNYCSYAERREE